MRQRRQSRARYYQSRGGRQTLRAAKIGHLRITKTPIIREIDGGQTVFFMSTYSLWTERTVTPYTETGTVILTVPDLLVRLRKREPAVGMRT